jgi:hypothetical protein
MYSPPQAFKEVTSTLSSWDLCSVRLSTLPQLCHGRYPYIYPTHFGTFHGVPHRTTSKYMISIAWPRKIQACLSQFREFCRSISISLCYNHKFLSGMWLTSWDFSKFQEIAVCRSQFVEVVKTKFVDHKSAKNCTTWEVGIVWELSSWFRYGTIPYYSLLDRSLLI